MSNVLYIPEEVKETLLYMDYVGGVTHGKKLFIKELTYVGESDYMLRIKRYMENEKIDSQVVFLKDLFNSYVKLKNEYNGLFTQQLNESFKRFHLGLFTLCVTYNNNVKLNKLCDSINGYRKRRLL